MPSTSPQEIIQQAVSRFGDKLILASSLGPEDQVLTHMVVAKNPKIPVLVLDTGRLHQETYDVFEQTREQLCVNYIIAFPEAKRVQDMVQTHGPNLFRKSIELRHQCCQVRKIEPLKRVLAGFEAWICGLRRQQDPSRANTELVEWDDVNQLTKINPLAFWSKDQVWDYIGEHRLPYNTLHDQNYPSIGCQPCTRAVKPGESMRSGRWWWENETHKECGLHWVHGRPQPKRSY